MSHRLDNRIIIMSTALVLGGAIFNVSHAALTVSPQLTPSTVAAGEPFSLDLVVSNDNPVEFVAGFDLTLEYDPSVAVLEGYTFSNALGDLASFEAEDWSFAAPDAGTISLIELSYLTDLSFQSTTFTMAHLTFASLTQGTTDLTITSVAFANESGDPISYTILSQPSVTVANPIPEPTSAQLLLFGLAGGLTFIQRKK